MKTLVKIVFLVSLSVLGTNGFAQKGGKGHGGGHGNGHGHGNRGAKVVVHHNGNGNQKIKVKSKYRPAKVVVYHPVWRPAYTYHRRWIYFPRYNFYWDNWRQGYYYRNGTVWVFNPNPPAVIVNVNLANEKNYELQVDEDDVDDIYIVNEVHVKRFPF